MKPNYITVTLARGTTQDPQVELPLEVWRAVLDMTSRFVGTNWNQHLTPGEARQFAISMRSGLESLDDFKPNRRRQAGVPYQTSAERRYAALGFLTHGAERQIVESLIRLCEEGRGLRATTWLKNLPPRPTPQPAAERPAPRYITGDGSGRITRSSPLVEVGADGTRTPFDEGDGKNDEPTPKPQPDKKRRRKS